MVLTEKRRWNTYIIAKCFLVDIIWVWSWKIYCWKKIFPKNRLKMTSIWVPDGIRPQTWQIERILLQELKFRRGFQELPIELIINQLSSEISIFLNSSMHSSFIRAVFFLFIISWFLRTQEFKGWLFSASGNRITLSHRSSQFQTSFRSCQLQIPWSSWTVEKLNASEQGKYPPNFIKNIYRYWIWSVFKNSKEF